MGQRLDKLRQINEIADHLKFSPASRFKLLLASYLERLRARFSWVPNPTLHVQFPFEGRTAHYHMRSNDVDFIHLGSLFVRREYLTGSKPARILDLGGNIGAAAIYFHCCYPDAEIVSVEPLPANVEMLKMNWEANGIKGRILQAAVAHEAGEAQFYVGDVDCSSLIARPGIEKQSITVKLVTIPDIMQQMGWDEIDLMKIDIEGGEVPLFRASAGWAPKVAVMIGELHNGYSLAEADRDLGFNFTCVKQFEYPAPASMIGLHAVRKA